MRSTEAVQRIAKALDAYTHAVEAFQWLQQNDKLPASFDVIAEATAYATGFHRDQEALLQVLRPDAPAVVEIPAPVVIEIPKPRSAMDPVLRKLEPPAVPTVVVDGRNDAIKQINAALKARKLSYSVTGGRGTAWGWIHINPKPARIKALRGDETALKAEYVKMYEAFGLTDGYSTGISIASSSDYYREYIERANGRTPTKVAAPYWD